MCIVHFDSGACALPQLGYGFPTSAYQSTHMDDRDEQPVANLYVWLPRHVLHLHQATGTGTAKALLQNHTSLQCPCTTVAYLCRCQANAQPFMLLLLATRKYCGDEQKQQYSSMIYIKGASYQSQACENMATEACIITKQIDRSP